MRREGHEEDRSHVTRDLTARVLRVLSQSHFQTCIKGLVVDELVLARQKLTCLVRDPRIARQRGYEGIGYEVRVKLIEHLDRATRKALKILDG